LPKWKKDAREYTVTVTFYEHRGYQMVMPKPVMELLGNPKKVKFVVKGRKTIEVQAAE
jgi:hypothetical protein